MIEFRLSERSGVPTYLQLVQQVRQAVRLGVLQAGDQLPTVKEVVGKLAINPNTVLKAYRELDHEGLVEARRGQGTFVSRTLQATPPAEYAALQSAPAPLDRDRRGTRGSTKTTSPRSGGNGRSCICEASSVSSQPAVETDGLGKRYGSLWALRDCTLDIPVRLGCGARRAERGRQDDAPAHG